MGEELSSSAVAESRRAFTLAPSVERIPSADCGAEVIGLCCPPAGEGSPANTKHIAATIGKAMVQANEDGGCDFMLKGVGRRQ